MTSVSALADLEARLSGGHEEAERFFANCEALRQKLGASFELSEDLARKGKEISARFDGALVRIASLVRQSPMFGNTDLQAMQLTVRQISAALRLRRHREWGPEVLHDEGLVLGVSPAGFSEDELSPPEALAELDKALDQVSRRVGVLRAQVEAEVAGEAVPTWLPHPPSAPGLRVQPGTAFILMMIDPDKPELEDIKRAIQEEFARFGVKAIRADDIEHSGEITHRILDEIKSAEFLVADLTGERPSVYYEVGFAHAIGKRPILYRRAGTRLHFDLAVHNCPEYTNLTDLKEKLNKRLKTVVKGE
jgi:hypothetical protein